MSCFLSALSFRVSFLLRPPSIKQCSINTVMKIRQCVCARPVATSRNAARENSMLFCAASATISGQAFSLFFNFPVFKYVAAFSIFQRLTVLLMNALRSPYTSHLLKRMCTHHTFAVPSSELTPSSPQVIQQMHRDHVPSLPPGCALLGASARSPVQGVVRFYAPDGTPPDDSTDTTTTTNNNNNTTSNTTNTNTNTNTTTTTDSPPSPSAPLPPIHILAVQGHPEFAESVVAPLVSTRAASGAIDASTAAAYEANGKGVKDDGRGRIARAVWGVMRGEM